MTNNVEVPALGESITEATLLQWLKGEGEQVSVDEPIAELESDKATVDLPAPASGVLHRIKEAGQTARVGEVIAEIRPAGGDGKGSGVRSQESGVGSRGAGKPKAEGRKPEVPMPAPEQPPKAEPPPPAAAEEEYRPAEEAPRPVPAAASPTEPSAAEEGVRRVPMSKIRRRIAERLVRAQQTAAMLTTFNEIDMTAVQELRARHQEQFKKMHGVSLGLMSFFARACVLALKRFPSLNAEIENDEILYHEPVHLGIAVSSERGLVVPVLRHAESMSFAKIEGEIKRMASAARDGKLSIQDLSGGTFTITNGGVFGSLLSTPILNPPQTGILGMHAIQERAVVVSGRIEARPMMYVALTYDHRLVDGHEAVSFLVKVKQLLEEPMQMILEI
jgi:2-oxoglutarate dehydrogenase E2 component (dihydrolipoamide succinyltransferase)